MRCQYQRFACARADSAHCDLRSLRRATAPPASARGRRSQQPSHAARATVRFNPAIASVGAICFGQRSVQEPWVWHDVAAGVAGDCAQTLGLLDRANVVDERPGAVERGRAEEVGPPGDDVARRIAHARSRCIRCRRRRAARSGEAGSTRAKSSWRVAVPLNRTSGTRPLVEEFAHVGDEVLDHRQVGERRDLERPLPSTTLATCVRQVQRALPLTVIAQEPHMPTRQANR